MKGYGGIKMGLICGMVTYLGWVEIGFAASGAFECRGADLTDKQKMQIKLFVRDAQELINHEGIQTAGKTLMSPAYIHEDLYIFVIDHRQYSLANGGRADLVGKNLQHIQDARVSAKKIINKAKKGGGWVSYQWMSPTKHVSKCKTSWVTPLLKDPKSEQIYTIGAGIEH